MSGEEKQAIPQASTGKRALDYAEEAHARGIIASAEQNGVETAGAVSAAADAARETGVTLLLLWALLVFFPLSSWQVFSLLAIFLTGWLVWRYGRASWLAWSRLERLHRLLAEKRWEIEHHRNDEREVLRSLYRAKGLSGDLLDQVIEVLMADEDRLLRIMVEEEFGLSLAIHDHPLMQGLGAAIGVALASIVCLPLTLLNPTYGLLTGALAVVGLSAAISAHFERNDRIPALVWTVGMGVLAMSFVYFLMDLFQLLV